MNKQQAQVLEFHEGLARIAEKRGLAKHFIGTTPGLHNMEFRRKLIEEEFNELIEAFEAHDFVGVIDAIMDLKYVLDGSMVEFGVDGEAFFDEVHRTNMAKLDGGYFDENGKFRKPAGWKEPRIEEMLQNLLRAVA